MKLVKENELDIKNIESADISNLLELALSNIKYSKERIIHYTFLIEEALIFWRENLPKEGILKYNVKRTKKNIIFSFSIKGDRFNPFLVNDKKEEKTPLDSMVDKLLSGVGSELKYFYKGHNNIIILKLPLCKDYEKTLYARNLIFLMIPMAIQQFFLSIAGNLDYIMLGFIDADAMSAVSLVSQFCQIADIIGSSIAIAGVAVLSQFWGKRDRNSVDECAGIVLKLALFFGFIFATVSLIFPREIISFYTEDVAITEKGTIYLRLIAIPILLNILAHALFCFMQVVGDVKKAMFYSLIACIVNTIFNTLLIFGLLGIKKFGIRGAAIATIISYSVQAIVLITYTILNKEIRIKFITKNKKLINPIIKIMLPTVSQFLIWSLAMNIVASCYGHLGGDVVSAYSVMSFLNCGLNAAGVGFRNGTAIWTGRFLGKKQFELAKTRANQGIKLTAFSYMFILPFFVIAGVAVHLLPIKLNQIAQNYFDIMLIVGAFNLFFSYLNKVICGGVLQTGGDNLAVLIIDAIVLWGLLVPISLLKMGGIIDIPKIVIIIIFSADEAISFPLKYIRYKKYKWLKSTTNK